MLFGKRKRMVRRLLVVEDEPLIAFDNEHSLEDAGYEVVATVDNVAEARRMLAGAAAIDLVLADMSLADGTGIDIGHAARSRGVPVLFVTADCPPEARPLALGCLSKPYEHRHFLDAIAAVDALLAGRPPRKLPPRLELFAAPDSGREA